MTSVKTQSKATTVSTIGAFVYPDTGDSFPVLRFKGGEEHAILSIRAIPNMEFVDVTTFPDINREGRLHRVRVLSNTPIARVWHIKAPLA